MEKQTRRRFLKGASIATTAGLAGYSGGIQDETIEFWHIFGGQLGKTLEEMSNEFSEKTDGVTVKAINKGGYRQNLNQSLQASRAGDPPGVAQIFEIGTRLALDSGAFTPVRQIIPEEKVDFDDFLPSVLNYYRIGGELHSMPFNSSNTIMLYNKTAFEEAGLDPEGPWSKQPSLSEVREAAQAVVDQTDIEQGITWPNHSWMQIEQQFAKQDQILVNKENGRAGRPDKTFYNSDAGRNVYNWWTDMADAGLYLNPGIEAWGEARQAFLTKKVPMLWDSTSNMVSMKAGAKENDFELGSAYLPTPNAANNGVVIGGGSLWVPSALSDAKKEAAGEFIAWMTQPEQQVRWHKNSGYFPVRQGAIDQLTSEGWFEENPDFRTAFDQLKDTKDTPATRGAVMGVWPKARTINSETSVSIVNGNISIEKGLKRMDTQVQKALEGYTGGN